MSKVLVRNKGGLAYQVTATTIPTMVWNGTLDMDAEMDYGEGWIPVADYGPISLAINEVRENLRQKPGIRGQVILPPRGVYLMRDSAADQEGPFTPDQLRSMWTQGSLTGSALVWWDGIPEWLELEPIMSTSTVNTEAGPGLLVLGVLSLLLGALAGVPGILMADKFRPFSPSSEIGHALCWVGCVLTVIAFFVLMANVG